MFIYCGSGTTTTSGGSTITNNYYQNSSLLPNTINFLSNVPSNHCSFSAYNKIGDAAFLSAYPGVLTLTFFEEIIFKKILLKTPAGTNTAVLKNKNGTILYTLPITGTTLLDSKKCWIIELHLASGTGLQELLFETPFFYQRKEFSDIDFFRTYNAYSDGTKLLPATGLITIEFPEPTIIFETESTGTVFYYDNAQNVFTTSSNETYPNPITKIICDTDLTAINYYCPSINLQNGFIETTVDFTTFQNGYIDPRHEAFTSSGVCTPLFTGTITFRVPTIVTAVTAITTAINGYNHNPASFVYPIKTNTLQLTGASEIRFFDQVYFYPQRDYINIDFTTVQTGEINISNDYFAIESADQLNNPAMVNGAKNIIFSADSNAAAPLQGSGLIIITAPEQTLFRSITLASGSGTAIMGTASYALGPVETFLNDFVSGGEYAKTIQINLNGELQSISVEKKIINNYQPTTTVIENFEQPSYDFSTVIFDTNTPGPYGSPNTFYGGPGIGSGGAIANSTYLGGATLSNINFTTPTYVDRIKFLNTQFGSSATLDGNIYYLPNYGANGIYTLTLKKKITSIILNSTAIYEIIYEAQPRINVSLIDNSSVRASLGFLTGNLKLQVVGSANTQIIASKSFAASPGTIFLQVAPAQTGESVYAEWLPNQPLSVYHGTLKSGGTGVPLYYYVF